MVLETKAILITGKPGCGKTTLVRLALARSRADAGGFYTEEIREHGIRQGFRVVTLDGRSAVMAHVGVVSPYRVGRYGVDIDVLEEVAVSAIRDAIAAHDIVVIDEIGKMELFSAAFREAVMESFNCRKKVLATVMLAASAFADRLKKRADVSLVMLDRGRWQKTLDDVLDWLGRAETGVET